MDFRYFIIIILSFFVISSCQSDASDDHLDCPEDMIAMDGVCACLDGLALCGERCVDLDEHILHCGGCDAACGFGQRCAEGICQCLDGYLECGGACVDPQSDASHCGDCGQNCAEGQNCVAGQCRCEEGLELCGEHCVDTQIDRAHCGDCGTVCSEAQDCVGGRCECRDGLTFCDGVCVDTQANVEHCSACGAACQAGEFCVEGVCRLDCPDGMTKCADTCYDLSKTTNHCGRCYNKCKLAENAAEMMCVDSVCTIANCDDGATLCDGECKDTRNDASNCGACGKLCASNEMCHESSCRWSSLAFGSSEKDKIMDVARDADGNFYLAGTTHGVFPGQIMRGGADAFLLKMSPSGIILWLKQWGTSADDAAVSLVIGEDSAIYVAGNTMGSFESIITTNEQSVFLSKFDLDGENIYHQQFGTMQTDAVVRILSATGGGVYMAGNTRGTISDFIVYGGIDSFVMKIAADGKAIYKKLYGTSKDDILSDMAVKSGKIYLIGTTHGPLHEGILTSAAVSPNMYIIKLSDNGNDVSKDWVKEFGSLQADAGRLIAVINEDVEVKKGDDSKELVAMDVIYAFGETQSKTGAHFDGHPTPNTGQAAFLMRIDDDGARINSRIFANEGTDYSLSALGNGHLPNLESEGVFALTGKLVDNGKSYPFIWQLLNTGQVLSSSTTLGQDWGSIEAVLGDGGEFYLVGGADEIDGQAFGNGDGFIMRRFFEL